MPSAPVPFADLVKKSDFPCLGARAAARRGLLWISNYSDAAAEVARVAQDLSTFVSTQREPPSQFAAFAVVDEGARCSSESDFEAYLWDFLKALHEEDLEPWDARFSREPSMPNFKYSFAGQAMFVIGLHPRASRRSRRSREHVVVFNPVWQFDLLRATNQLDDFVEAIRRRDIAWDGVVNPNLAFEGKYTDALQYSGREVDEKWNCPHSRW